MKVIKIVAILALVYVAVVVAFETWLGISQPEGAHTLTITTYDSDGDAQRRVLSRLDSGGQIYVAANHWPRAWYRQALAHAQVKVDFAGQELDYRAVPVSGEEHDRVRAEHEHGIGFRILTGFPPRYFVRLDPL